MACMEDDAIGARLTVFREREIDFEVLGESSWEAVAQRGFDQPKQFAAYLNTLRWNCVTATDAELFQAPYRAGIDVKAYQLEPLRKALQMPRVGLFIADDVGLGKTIEAGLILREMLLRQRIKRVVISCPPSVLRQWQEEMASRFGLAFTVMDRAYVAKVRQERGYGTNPWSTHSRFLISHALLRNSEYSAPLRVLVKTSVVRFAEMSLANSRMRRWPVNPAFGYGLRCSGQYTRRSIRLAVGASMMDTSRPVPPKKAAASSRGCTVAERPMRCRRGGGGRLGVPAASGAPGDEVMTCSRRSSVRVK
jgi:hypothetical protein